MLSNIIKGFFWQGIGLVAAFVSLPISIDYLGFHDFGLWVTIYGIILWLGGMDLGISNGYRNELATSLANKDYENSSFITSNAYFTIIAIVIIIILVIQSISTLVQIYNPINDSLGHPLSLAIFMLVIFIGFEMIFKLAAVIYTADQRSSVLPMITGINALVILVVVFILNVTKFELSGGRVLTYAIMIGLVPLITNLALTIYAFSGNYSYLRPNISDVKYDYIKRIFNIGSKFFGIQLAMILFLQLTNFLVASWSSPSDVAILAVAEKYFGLISVAGSILLFPFWSKFTEANEHGRHIWIKGTIFKLELMFLMIIFFTVISVVVFPYIQKIWLDDIIQVPFSYTLLISLKYLFILWNSLYCYYLNGIGDIKPQLYLYAFFAIINIPCSYILFQFFGINGVLMVIPVLMFFMALLMKFRVYKILSKKIMIKNKQDTVELSS